MNGPIYKLFIIELLKFRRAMTIILVLFALSSMMLKSSEGQSKKIGRSVEGLELGMLYQDAIKILPLSKKEEGKISLMRKFGFGDPAKEIEKNKILEKQVFEIKKGLSNGLSSIEVFFRKGVLYQIALHYGDNYVKITDWDLFTLPAIKRYGPPEVRNHITTLSSFSYQWTDGITTLEIAKSGTLSNDKTKFIPSRYNVFFTDKNTSKILSEEEERFESQKETKIPGINNDNVEISDLETLIKKYGKKRAASIIAEDFNKNCPLALDENTRINYVLPYTNKLSYQISVIGISYERIQPIIATLKDRQKSIGTNRLCTSEDTKDILEAGYIIEYQFYSEDGSYLYSYDIRKTDCDR